MVTRLRVRPGTSTPCQNPRVAKRQVGSLSVNASMSAGLGRSDWDSTGKEQAVGQGVDGGVHGPPAGEQGQGPSAGRVDQGLELVVDGRLRLGPAAVGQGLGHVQHGVVGIVERTAHVELVGRRRPGAPAARAARGAPWPR